MICWVRFYCFTDNKDVITETQIFEFYEGKIASWQIPDKVVFVDNILLNGAGKMIKKDLRDEHGDVLLIA